MKSMEEFICCELAEEQFGKTNKVDSYIGDISVKYLTTPTNPHLETGAREYQREKVATLQWKQKIMLTVISNSYVKIPQVHIRVIKDGDSYKFELIDGQQRITAIIDYVNGKYSLPNDDSFNLGNGVDVRGKKFQELPKNIKNQILEYRITCLWYENLTDEQTAALFINVLNNTNSMKPQEIRNAVRGFLSTLIRNTARFEERHDLFERVTSDNKKKKQTTLKHFSQGFTLGNRMEVDEWFSELIYMRYNGYRNGVTQSKHTKWIIDVQKSGGKFSTQAQFNEFNEITIEPLISFAYNVITSVSSDSKHKLSPMVSQMLVLYGMELRDKYGKLHIPVYTKKFFEVYNKWSNSNDKLYMNEIMWGTKSEQMEPFYKLFGGKNPKAIGTIVYVLNKELTADEDSFGVVEIDTRDFTKAEIIRKWEEQGRKCFFTKEPLELKNICGDHYIPRSYGIKRGGVTEYHNLVVCHHTINNQKLNIHGDDFIKQFKKEELV
jgi:hypothetical protein